MWTAGPLEPDFASKVQRRRVVSFDLHEPAAVGQPADKEILQSASGEGRGAWQPPKIHRYATAGRIFWFNRNWLPGSYFALIARKRSSERALYASVMRASPSSATKLTYTLPVLCAFIASRNACVQAS